ncbi:MAG: penicillin acylase family protein [Rhodothermales bacterium]
MPHVSSSLFLDGMDAPVHVEVDARGVPHIHAGSEKDATIALGYVVARDRLFEMEFIWRAATGRLAELLGPAAVEQDRYFRDIGMVHAVRNNTELLMAETSAVRSHTEWYVQGANAWVESLSRSEWPFEFRLFGRGPSRVTPEHTQALFSFMAYDLSFRSDDVPLDLARQRLGGDGFRALYPEFSTHEKYIVPSGSHIGSSRTDEGTGSPETGTAVASVSSVMDKGTHAVLDGLAEGLRPGKGSNNWAVNGHRSLTGMPILAGDMHLNLSLPAIWYEVHVVTPESNSYGVTFPSAPAIIEGITETHAWAFTNTGTDQLDTYLLQLDETGERYLHDGQWKPLVSVVDTIRVHGGPDVVHGVRWSHHGPVRTAGDRTLAIRWVGHEYGRTLEAFLLMNKAVDHASFEEATRSWDYPMQNILYAGRDSIISLRSTGYLPIRGTGSGAGILDGTSSSTEWVGRVPFDALPVMHNPGSGWVSSTNQRPAGADYPWYLGTNWEPIHRSQRIHELMTAAERHGVGDLKTYQADVYAKQADYLVPVLAELDGLLAASAERVRFLSEWDRRMTVESREATLFAQLVDTLEALVWDEPSFDGIPPPSFVRMFDLHPDSSVWFDIQGTPEREDRQAVLKAALSRLDELHEVPPWGQVHTLRMRHLTRSTALRPLWREGMPYPGWRETLSPADGMAATHSASWRVVVDLSTQPPTAWGVYPGGQSGNPFSRLYDAHVTTFTSFEYYPLNLSRTSPRDTSQ